MPSDVDRRQIELILARGLATREQVTECLMERPVDSPDDIAGELVGRGVITATQAEQVREAIDTPAQTGAPRIEGYEVLEELGSGAMGVVYKARQVSMNRPVAVKVLPPALTQDAEYVKRFIREARTGGKLNHPNIVQGIDVGKTDAGSYYFVMEFVEGESVQDILKREGGVPVEQALGIVRDIASALQHASGHGLIHRDVKPENIMVSRNGAAKLADLGLAAPVGQIGRESTQVAGTPHYIAPEIVRGDRDIDVRADIYSLGATFFHMVTGTVPFDGPSAAVVMTKHLSEPFPAAHDRNRNVPQAVSQVIAKMTARNKTERYATAEALITDLDRMLRGEVAMSAPRALRPPGARSARRSTGAPVGAIFGVVTALALVIAVVYVATLPPPDQPGPGIPSDPVKPGPSKPGPATPQATAEQKANEALAEAQEFLTQNPGDHDGAERLFEAVVRRFPGTYASTVAKRQAETLRGKRNNTLAGQALAELSGRADKLVQDQRYGEAAGLYRGFLRQYGGTTSRERAQIALDGIIAKAKTRYRGERTRAEAHVSKKEYATAVPIYQAVAAWNIEEVSPFARTRITELEDLIREQRAAGQRRQQELIGKAKAQFDAAVNAREYADAAAIAQELTGRLPEDARARYALMAADMKRLDALHRKIIELLRGKIGDFEFSAKGAIGQIIKADETGITVKSGKLRVTAAWGEISGKQYDDLAGRLIPAKSGQDLLDLALMNAWHGEVRAAETRLGQGKAAGADAAATAVRLLALRGETESREGEERLAAIQKLIAGKEYEEATGDLARLEKALGDTPFYKANRKRINALTATCEEHHVLCPECHGRGHITCTRCNGQRQVILTKDCPKCAGIGKIRRGMDLETCPKCRGRGKIRVRADCPRCLGKGVTLCPTCKGEKKVYR